MNNNNNNNNNNNDNNNDYNDYKNNNNNGRSMIRIIDLEENVMVGPPNLKKIQGGSKK